MCTVSWPSFIVISSILFKTCPLCTINKLILIWCSSRYLSSFPFIRSSSSFVFYYPPRETEIHSFLFCLYAVAKLLHLLGMLSFIIYIFRDTWKSLLPVVVLAVFWHALSLFLFFTSRRLCFSLNLFQKFFQGNEQYI